MPKKAQFYVFDAFFAALILFVGVGFLISQYSAVPDQTATQILTFDSSRALTENTLDDIFTNYTLQNYDILNPAYTPAQQIQVWWHNESCSWCLDNASELTESMFSSFQFGLHGVNVTIQNDTNQTTIFSSPIDREAELMIVNQQIVLTGTYGPDILEVRVWR